MKVLRVTLAVLLAAFVVYGVAFKLGYLPAWPPLLVALAALILVAASVLLVATLAAWIRTGEPLRHLAGVLLYGGVLLVLGGGMANWLLSLQGFVILTEGTAMPLSMTSHLQAFEGGPLSNVYEMDMTLELAELELVAGGSGRPVPQSRIRVSRSGEPLLAAELEPGQSAEAGTLHFHQGAFGYAPRIVVLKDGEEMLDEVVPFTTERQGPEGLSFLGEILIRAEELRIEGQVDLTSLDEALQGHPRLQLRVERRGELIGRGSLLPGHFADIEDGYRVGFAGLEKWSEIDISRRNYPQVMLAGLASILAGGVLAAAVRKRGGNPTPKDVEAKGALG